MQERLITYLLALVSIILAIVGVISKEYRLIALIIGPLGLCVAIITIKINEYVRKINRNTKDIRELKRELNYLKKFQELKEEISFKEIEINIKNPTSNVEITVTKLDEKPATIAHEIKDKIYQYIEIKKENIKEEDINNAVINFKVEKEWLIKNNADENDVVLNRYTTYWKELETSKKSSDVKYVYYKATTPSFSYFAIVVKEKIALVENATVTDISNVTERNITKQAEDKVEKEEKQSTLIWFFIISLIVIIVLISYFYVKKRK